MATRYGEEEAGGDPSGPARSRRMVIAPLPLFTQSVFPFSYGARSVLQSKQSARRRDSNGVRELAALQHTMQNLDDENRNRVELLNACASTYSETPAQICSVKCGSDGLGVTS